MADVTPLWRREERRDADRGQLFLIGALSLAVLLITVALLLNTAIYTENIATRGGGTDSAEVIGFQNAAQAQSVDAFEHVNCEHNASYGDLRGNYTASMNVWEDTAARHRAAEGHVGEVTVNDTTEGTRIVQDDDRNFTDANGNASWELVADANARNYTITAQPSSLITSDTGNLTSDPVFRVAFEASNGDVWSIYIYDGTVGDITVAVVEPDGTIDSRGADSPARLDITNATLDGDSWDALRFFDDLGEGYDVSYEYGDATTGTYSLAVDRNVSAVDGAQYHDDSSGDSPYVTPALYDAEIDIVYQTQMAYYEAKYRVAPGEADV